VKGKKEEKEEKGKNDKRIGRKEIGKYNGRIISTISYFFLLFSLSCSFFFSFSFLSSSIFFFFFFSMSENVINISIVSDNVCPWYHPLSSSPLLFPSCLTYPPPLSHTSFAPSYLLSPVLSRILPLYSLILCLGVMWERRI
jgi:hypothetical protein